MCQLSPVTFHGDTIFCIDYQNQPYTPMKPIVENMGLAWQSQCQKLNTNKERWGITNIVIPSNGGEQEMLCMPVRKLPSYLNSINPRKVRPELRAKIELYQAESDDALWNYWMHGRAERPAPQTAEAAITPDQQCTLQAIVRARVEGIPAERRGKGLYPQIWSRFNSHFRLGSYKQLPQCRMSEAVAYLTRMEIAPALPPQPERLPLYRNGAFYLPPANNPAHKPGPQEAALLELWQDWTRREAGLRQEFMAMLRELDARRGDLFSYAVSDLGRNADTMFSTQCLLDSLFQSRTEAEQRFRQALDDASLHLRLSLNVAVALGR
ncbi:phage antirepressor N-terminal domain-containing protein [uncultured Desulfovibrio sp.]|uniref:phage antirepressor N-terminal domain-containing protein n=1 Tax=uncultured Desulfovibrio sp. TaxID=167968 RepID=UPI00260A56E5|nr:phage antirepressor N-terminal domain-containing protein [uncultured Desulfovibrio sp.]